MMESITITGVCERDVDLLLMEELHSSADFRSWFVEVALGRIGHDEFVGVRRSVTHSSGESDLEVAFRTSEGKTLMLLIENKVDAEFQKKQEKRYDERGKDYKALGKCDAYHTIITAPSNYMNNPKTDVFGGKVTFEQIRDWFSQQGQLGERSFYKTELLRCAVDKQSGAEKDPTTTKFWRDYWEFLNGIDPELSMDYPSSKRANATFVNFKPSEVPREKGYKLMHKFNHGRVDLQIAGLGKRLETVRELIDEHLDDGMTIVKSSASASVAIEVPRLKASVRFEEQTEKLSECLAAVRRMLDWFVRTRSAWSDGIIALKAEGKSSDS